MKAPVFIVGAQRCGTSRLFSSLDAHPDLVGARPVRPEPKYFLRPDADTTGPAGWVATCFDGAVAGRVPFEKSTSYIESDLAVDRIQQVFPQAHVVILLRDPVERAISNYRFSVANGLEDRPPEQALLGPSLPWDPQHVSVDPYDYIGRSTYSRHLRRWQERFAPTLHVLLFEEFVRSPVPLQRLYRAVGVDDGFLPAHWAEAVNTVSEEGAPAEVGDELRRALSQHLAPATRELARQLGRPLDAWPSAPAR